MKLWLLFKQKETAVVFFEGPLGCGHVKLGVSSVHWVLGMLPVVPTAFGVASRELRAGIL